MLGVVLSFSFYLIIFLFYPFLYRRNFTLMLGVVISFIFYLITHANSSHVSIALICLCDSVCLHDKTKSAETKIAKLGTGLVCHCTSLVLQYLTVNTVGWSSDP